MIKCFSTFPEGEPVSITSDAVSALTLKEANNKIKILNLLNIDFIIFINQYPPDPVGHHDARIFLFQWSVYIYFRATIYQ